MSLNVNHLLILSLSLSLSLSLVCYTEIDTKILKMNISKVNISSF